MVSTSLPADSESIYADPDHHYASLPTTPPLSTVEMYTFSPLRLEPSYCLSKK